MKKNKGRQRNILLLMAAIISVSAGLWGNCGLYSFGFLQRGFSHTVTKALAATNNYLEPVYGSNLTMQIDYGYDQYVKYGRNMELRATITNEGEDFAGWLQVLIPKSEDNVAYQKEITVKEGMTQEISIIVPIINDTGYLQVKLLDDEQDTVLEKTITLQFGNYEKLNFVGILTEEEAALKYMDNYGTKVFYLDETSLSEEYLGLELLDVIVINHFDTNRLSDKQVAAIEKWVMNGGSLVLGTGEYAQETLAKLSEPFHITFDVAGTVNNAGIEINEEELKELKQGILDYEESLRIFLESIKSRNEMLISYGNTPINIDYSLLEKWSKEKVSQLKTEEIYKNIAKVSLTGGSNIFIQDDLTLMQTAPLSHGNVMLFSFDLGLEEEYVTTGLGILTVIRTNLSNTKQKQLEEEYYGYNTNQGIYNSISSGGEGNVPSTAKYILILGLYICLAGPITYLILKKLDKRSLTWGIIPLIAVVFTLIVYFMGSDTRIDKPYVDYVKLLNFGENNTVREEMYFSLTAPYNYGYSINMDNTYDIVELSNRNAYSYDYNEKKEIDFNNYKSIIQLGLDNTAIKISNNPAFSPVYYQSETTYDMSNQMNYDLRYSGEKITGTVTNGFDFNLYNAVLMSDGYLITLGDIKQDEEVSVEDKNTVFLSSTNDIYNKDILTLLTGENQEIKTNSTQYNRLSTLLNYFIENNLINEEMGSFIIGFQTDENVTRVRTDQDTLNVTKLQNNQTSKEQGNLLSDLANNLEAYGTTVLKLPVEVDYTLLDKEFVSSIDSSIVLEQNYYDKYYQARYLESEDMKVEYRFPEHEKILSFEYLETRNQDNNSEYLTPFEGKIYFLNVETGKYDEVFTTGVGSSVTQVEKYLSNKNSITVRYSTELSLKGFQILIPHISYWKEG